MPQLDGRAFSRQQQYEALPTELKDEVSALVDYLTAQQTAVFGLHHANLLKTVRSVRAKPLTEKITAWLLQKEEGLTTTAAAPAGETVVEAPAAPAVEETKPATEEEPKKDEAAAPAPPSEEEAAAAKEAAAKAKEEAAAKAKAEQEAAAAKAKADQEASAARLAHAKKLLEALVLKGFVTPYKESEKLQLTPLAAPETFNFKDSELFVPLAAAIAAEPAASAPATQEASTSETTEAAAAAETTASASAETVATTTPAPLATTVWDLIEGAVFAGALKRKAGFLAPLTSGKDVYAVVNSRRKTLTLFESDLGRAPLLEIGFEGTSVAFDKSHYAHGIKVFNETITELLNASTKLEREALVHALLAIGLTYHEDLAPGLEKIETIYELKDTGIDGEEISLDKYKGKVLLIVNVSSKCGLTPTNYPELVALQDKYREQGFEVLAFPCNQFMGQEPGSHEEIKAFVAQYNPTFQFFSKGDVNGVDARPVFAFLKHKLPAAYIQWNFTKFLVDRNGVPVKRFGPMELPLSFEGEIVKLIAEEAKPEIVAAEEAAAPVAAEAAVESAAVAAAAPAVEEATAAAPAAPAPAVEEAAPVAAAPAVVEATPEVAPVEETKAPVPVEAEKPAVVEAPKVEETKIETPAPAPAPTPAVEAPAPVVETPAPVVEQTKVEEVLKTETTPESPAEEPAPATKIEAAAAIPSNQEEEIPAQGFTAASKAEPAAAVESNQDIPVQGFTPGNEPTAP